MSSPQLHYYTVGEKVTAFSSTRYGGCSEGNYRSFNVNRYCGDDEEHIARNLESLKSLLGVSQVFMPHQVHGTEVLRVKQSVPWEGMADDFEGVDAMITDVTGICIGVSTADCIPVLLYDEAHHAAAAIHAGWRGTVKRIVKKAVESMHDSFGTRPKELQAVIGPGISLESFEVGDEVYDQFQEEGFPMERIARRYPAKLPPLGGIEGGSKWHIDLPLCNRLQLEEVGVSQIELSGICTWQQSDDYFSARKLGVNSGRILTGVVLR
jgi:YfiH family protein